MRERRTVDRGIESRRTIVPQCNVLDSETLARYLMRAIDRKDVSKVETHLEGCDDCWATLESTYRLFIMQ